MIGILLNSLPRMRAFNKANRPQTTSAKVSTKRIQPALLHVLVGLSMAFASGSAVASIVPALDLDSNDSSGATGGDYQLTYNEQASSFSTNLADVGDVLITDADDTLMESAVFTSVTPLASHEFLYLASNYLTASEIGTTNQGISFTVSADRRTVNFTGSFSLADYQDALDDFRYYNSSDTPDTTPRIFEFSVNDGVTNSNLARTTMTVVAVNDAPVAADDSFAVVLGMPVNIDPLANDSDVDGTIPDIVEIIDSDGTVITLSAGSAQMLLSGTQVSLLGDGTLDVTRPFTSIGVERFGYVISDGSLTDQATIELDSDTDADGIGDTLDIDDDNDGIPDSVEGVWDGTTQLFTTGGFDPAHVIGFNPILSVDGASRYQVNVDIVDWQNVGTPDWTEGQYAVASSGSSHVNYPAIVDAPTPGTGFGIFSVNNEEFFKTVNSIPGETYQMSIYIGTLPIYSRTTGAQTIYDPDIEIAVLGATNLDGTVAELDATDLTQYTAADFPAAISSSDPGGYTQLDPHWEVLTLDVVATQPTMFFKVKTLNSNAVIVLDDINLDLTSSPAPLVDTDADGRADYLDIDSDDDGILDNTEAQGTSVYIAPSGSGTAMTDATGNGLDDNYEVAAGTTGFQVNGIGLAPYNTDAGAPTPDSIPDYIDLDSDNDTLLDNSENGLLVAMPAPSDNDTDFDGLKDAYEAVLDGVASDGYVSNEGISDPLATGGAYLPDEDADASSGVPLVNDLDYREEPVPASAPVATNDSASIVSGGTASIDLSDNVSDVDGDLDIATIDLDPATSGVQSSLTTSDGTWAVDAMGMVTFTPVAGFVGTATIPYTVSDMAGNTAANADITVTVSAAPNNAPVATNDSANVAADTNAMVDLSDNVSDVDGDLDITTIDIDPTTPGVQTTLTTADGVWTVNAAGIVTLDPAASFQGTTNLPYTVSDTAGNVSNTAVVSVVVAGATPVATNDSASVASGVVATVDLSDNVSDANKDVDVSTIDLDPSAPGVQSSLTTSDGTWSVNAAGAVTFTPVAGFVGTATIPYVVSDMNGNFSAPANISVTVAAAGTGAAPVATDDSVSIAAGVAANIDLSDNVTDVNGNHDIATIDLDPATPGVQQTLTTTDGSWSVNPAGMVTFTPTAGFAGTTTIPYVVSDVNGNVSAPANINVTVAGSAPVADAEVESTVQDTDITIDVLAGDTDVNGDIDPATLDLDPTTPAIQPTLFVAGEGFYSIVSGQIVFDPHPDFVGTANLDYVVSDAAGNLSNVASVTIDVLVDTDADGIPDSTDLDDDNDGLPDTLEGTVDTDGDGVIDSLDLDSDNDGLTDANEAGGADVDNDGVIDGFADGNNDGMDDTTAATPLADPDTDADGIVDHLDVDSDNDGIPDVTEAGGPDTDGDGIIDGFADTDGNGFNDPTEITPLPDNDSDGDGVVDHLDLDSDNDGIPDSVEAGSNPNAPVDTDADGIPDFLEVDSDYDGIPDSVEAGNSPATPLDSDADGTPDYQELDSDNDGKPDSAEAGVNPFAPVDSDGNNIPDYQEPDNTTPGPAPTPNPAPNPAPTPGPTNPDSDGDGITDALEGSADTDGDGIPNYLDIDSDNDGLLDTDEAGNVSQPIDTDGDGIVDYLDLDSDNDGLTDAKEAGGEDVDGNGIVDKFTDANGDGHDDGVGIAPLADPDSDGDGIVDHLDIDSDNDGLPDIHETHGSSNDLDGDGRVDNMVDTNADGLADAIHVNGLLDTDNDGQPNHLDLDSDGDSLLDIEEIGGTDADGDGRVDTWSDLDGNGIPDSVDVGITGGADVDNDGIVDYADVDFVNMPDSDGDGIVDAFDDDRSGSGFIPIVSGETLTGNTLLDTNANGVPDVLEINSEAAVQPNGKILSGLSGGAGCSIDGAASTKDPMLLLLMLSAGGLVLRRRRTKRVC